MLTFLFMLIVYVLLGGGLFILIILLLTVIIGKLLLNKHGNTKTIEQSKIMSEDTEKKTVNNKIDFNIDAIKKIDDYLKEHGVIDIKNDKNPVVERAHGKVFSNEEHLRALIYSLLTNQRKWSDVEPKLPQIDRIFFNYNYDKVKQHDGTYYEAEIRRLKCGNISIKRQMENLNDNIKVFEKIINNYGSIDRFVTFMPPEDVVKYLSSNGSQYKLKNVGTALAWEYLRNVGIDGSKPDMHLKRFFESDRIGISKNIEASDQEVIDTIDKLSKQGSYNRFEIDYLIWAYCAAGKAEICTTAPACEKCVIRDYCNMA